MKKSEMIAKIGELRKKRGAVILAHNYELGEIQDVADFQGDSLELSIRAAETDAREIVFCGVKFMAETAKILSPDKRVILPVERAGCDMADMADAAGLRALKSKHPGALVVCYVNSTAAVKAECDMCVTSGNAERVMASLPREREILFVPDQHLGGYIADKRGEKYVLWPGYCPTHARLTAKRILEAKAAHPGAPVLVHPECPKEVRDIADECLSTGGMCAYARSSEAREMIVGTEVGILHRLRAENPGKVFWPVDDALVCPNMKKTTLENLRDCLRDMSPKVTVDPTIATRAKRAIDAMLAVS